MGSQYSNFVKYLALVNIGPRATSLTRSVIHERNFERYKKNSLGDFLRFDWTQSDIRIRSFDPLPYIAI